MNSIVLDLQREAIDSDTDISNLLRKSLVIARKLNVKEFEEWASQELSGYMDKLDNIPDYREITGSLQFFHTVRGWCPAIIQDPEMADIFNKNKLRQPITELEYLIKREGENSVLKFPQEQQNLLCESFNYDTMFQLVFGKSQIQGVIDKIKNIILDWSLKLEEDGILGEGIKFSQKEKQEADKQNYTVNNFHGNISGVQIQQLTQHSTQTQTNEMDIEKVSEFIKNLQEHLSQTGLSEDKQKVIETEIEAITEQLSKKKPQNKVVKESIKTIRGLLEGVAGNYIAQALISDSSMFM